MSALRVAVAWRTTPQSPASTAPPATTTATQARSPAHCASSGDTGAGTTAPDGSTHTGTSAPAVRPTPASMTPVPTTATTNRAQASSAQATASSTRSVTLGGRLADHLRIVHAGLGRYEDGRRRRWSRRHGTKVPVLCGPVIVYPAVDIRNGRCVQLTQGRPDTEVVHHDDPAAQAALWVSLGADAIHVVNLDGALSYGAGTASALNLQRVAEIRRAVDVPVQFAGGLRDERDVETAFGLDVDRIVIGTAAVVRPELVAWALRRWGPDRVAVALEVKGGQVVTHGWQQTTPLTPVPFGADLYRMGVRTALYTDVDREGLLGGVDAAGAVALAEATGLRLVISGGVGGVDDIRALAGAGDAVEGVVIGQALYTGKLSLPEALAAAA